MKRSISTAAFFLIAWVVVSILTVPELRAEEGRPLPISCLYRKIPEPGESAAKRGARSVIAGIAIFPALKETPRGTAPDSMAVPVILIEWQDLQARRETNTPASIDRFLFSDSPFGGATMRDYYREVSQDRFRLGGGVTVWLRSTQSFDYYVNSDGIPGTIDDFGFNTSTQAFQALPYPTNNWGMVREAAILADQAGVDFSRFDNDGPDGIPSSGDDDGIVDAVIIIHAGLGAEGVLNGSLSASQIWSHKSDLSDPAILDLMGATTIDGVRIGPYILVPELGELGVYVHEFGHILGLPDLYGTFVENGQTVQQSLVGSFCVMDAGSLLPLSNTGGGTRTGSMPSHFNPFFKEWLGWLEPTAFEQGIGDSSRIEGIELPPIIESAEAIRLLSNPGGNDWLERNSQNGEYFFLEYRKQLDFDEYLPGEGLLIWHINESKEDNNAGTPAERVVGVVEADNGDGDSAIGFTDLGRPSDFWGGANRREWTPETSPSTAFYGSSFSQLWVEDIRVSPERITLDLDIRVPREGRAIVSPNPYRPEKGGRITFIFQPGDDSAGPESLHMEIYDLTGNLVRTLTTSSPGGIPADWLMSWDGMNKGARNVASGVYLYVIHGGGETVTGKIALLR